MKPSEYEMKQLNLKKESISVRKLTASENWPIKAWLAVDKYSEKKRKVSGE